MGSYPKPVRVNVTAPGLLRLIAQRGCSCFVVALQQLRSGLNKACGEAETFAFLGVSLLMVESLKLRV